MKKRILIVSKAFYPENSPRSFRTTELAKEFSKQGHEVTVLIPGGKSECLEFGKEHKLIIKDLGKLRWKSPDFGNSKFGILLTRVCFRILSLCFEFPDIELMFKVRKAVRNESNYDFLISIAVPFPIHWGVAWAWKKDRIIAKKWIADCGDPYMGNTLDSFKKPFYFMFVEKWFMRKTDYVSIPKIGYKENFYKEFYPKLVEIPQGFNFSEAKYEKSVENPFPTFAYAGSLMRHKRNPSVLLEYLVNLKSDYKFILYTKSIDLVIPYLEKSKGRIEIRDYIPRKELMMVLSQMDFLVNFEYDPKVISPSKLIDYGICKRPVLNILSEDFRANVVDEFLSGNYSNQFQLPTMQQYHIENVCHNFLSLQ